MNIEMEIISVCGGDVIGYHGIFFNQYLRRNNE